jgi:hypothetical protein
MKFRTGVEVMANEQHNTSSFHKKSSKNVSQRILSAPSPLAEHIQSSLDSSMPLCGNIIVKLAGDQA